MKKLNLIFVIITLSMIGACSSNTAQEETAPLQIGLMPTMDSVAIATAYELGLFADHGIEVELIPFSSASDRDAAFQAGALDGATVDLIAVGLFNEGGHQVRATSVTTAHFTLIGQAQYTDLASLADGAVMISNNTAIDFVLDQMLFVYGLPDDHIIREEVGNIPARFEMVRTGGANAALISEPFAAMAAAEGLAVISDTFQIDFNPFVLAFSLDVIENRIDEIQAFYLALDEAVDFLNSNPAEAYLDMIIELIGFPDDARNYIELPEFLPNALPDAEIIDIALDWLVGRELVSEVTKPESFIYEIGY